MSGHRERKLAFVVEGDTDKVVIERLAERILRHRNGWATVRLMVSPRVLDPSDSVLTLLEKGYPEVLVFFDADATGEEATRATLRVISRLTESISPHGTGTGGSNIEMSQYPFRCIPFEPSLEGDWIAEPLASKTVDAYRRWADTVNLDDLSRRSASFRSFKAALSRA